MADRIFFSLFEDPNCTRYKRFESIHLSQTSHITARLGGLLGEGSAVGIKLSNREEGIWVLFDWFSSINELNNYMALSVRRAKLDVTIHMRHFQKLLEKRKFAVCTDHISRHKIPKSWAYAVIRIRKYNSTLSEYRNTTKDRSSLPHYPAARRLFTCHFAEWRGTNIVAPKTYSRGCTSRFCVLQSIHNDCGNSDSDRRDASGEIGPPTEKRTKFRKTDALTCA